jgi:TorA maturation chaperone TorD
MTTEMKDCLSRHGSRRDYYKLLADCYYPPDAGLCELLRGLDRSKGTPYAEIANKAPMASELESLRIDYARLFLGPYELFAPPYGSVYLEDPTRVMGESTINARNTYAKEGLHVLIKETPDHIAIELEFMHYLVSKQIESSLHDDSDNASAYLAKQKEFLETHLSVWVPEFVDRMTANAETAFYRELAHCTGTFVKEDLRLLVASQSSTSTG